MIDQAVLSQAVRALLKHSQNVGGSNPDPFSKKQLFDEDNLISLIITLKTVPQTAAHTIQKLSLPFPIWDDQAQVCIFVRDPQREFKDKFEETGAQVTKVIGLTKLRKKWKTHEAKRKLCQSYDLFLCDDRILCLLPKLLGKNFFEKKKLPIPIKLTGLDPSKVVNNSRNFTTFQFATGHCCAVRVARTTMDPEAIIKNIKSVLTAIVAHIPQKWKNIQSLHIKTSDSIALPLYASLPAVLN
jgi:ribosome biogenesis protein UTP30